MLWVVIWLGWHRCFKEANYIFCCPDRVGQPEKVVWVPAVERELLDETLRVVTPA